MRALTYHGARDVRVESVPDPVIQEPDDVILRVTATATPPSVAQICIYTGEKSRPLKTVIFSAMNLWEL